jgi:hypothetical protein
MDRSLPLVEADDVFYMSRDLLESLNLQENNSDFLPAKTVF